MSETAAPAAPESDDQPREDQEAAIMLRLGAIEEKLIEDEQARAALEERQAKLKVRFKKMREEHRTHVREAEIVLSKLAEQVDDLSGLLARKGEPE